MKTCLLCKNEFEPDKYTPYQIYCGKRCCAIAMRIRNKEHIKEYNKQYQLEHKKILIPIIRECKNCLKEFTTNKFRPKQKFCSQKCTYLFYYSHNKEQIKEKERIYYINNKEKINKYTQRPEVKERKRALKKTEKYKEYARLYNKNNREIRRAIEQRYAAKYPEKIIEKRSKRRNLQWVKIMDNSFPKEVNIDWHHINNIFIVSMPRILHRACNSCIKKQHRANANQILNNMGFDLKTFMEVN